MKLVLFDIDGTLLSTGGIGQRSSRKALEQVFGTSGRLAVFYPGGRTQEAIFADTLADAGIETEHYLANRDRLYQVFLEFFVEGIEKGEHQTRLLPGAAALLKALQGEPRVLLGIVTGNHQRVGLLKLESAGIAPEIFQVGAFGHQTADRSELVPLARKQAEERTGREFPGKLTLVIGDTTRDVLSARKAGARSIAVVTGTDSRELLESVSPDHILENLSDLDRILEIILQPEG